VLSAGLVANADVAIGLPVRHSFLYIGCEPFIIMAVVKIEYVASHISLLNE